MSFNKITNENLKQRFTDPKITQSQLLELIKEFENAVADKTYADKGWPKWIYGISKLGINIYCNILGKRQDVLERGIQVYACCPGYVKTEMTSHKGVLTLDQGIKTPIYLV